MGTQKGAANHKHRELQRVATALEHILLSMSFENFMYTQNRQLESIFSVAVVDFGYDSSSNTTAVKKRVRKVFLKEQMEYKIPSTVKSLHVPPGRIELFCLSFSLGFCVYLSYLLVYHGSYILQVFNKCWLNAHIMNPLNKTQ